VDEQTQAIIAKLFQYLGGPAIALGLIKYWFRRMEDAVDRINKADPLLKRVLERLDKIERDMEHELIPGRVKELELKFGYMQRDLQEIQTATGVNGSIMKTLSDLASSVAILLDRDSRDTKGEGDRTRPGTKQDRQS